MIEGTRITHDEALMYAYDAEGVTVFSLSAVESLINRRMAQAWDEGMLAMKKARFVQGASLPPNPYRK